MGTTPTPAHVLTEVTCPHCQKKNLVAVVKPPAVTSYNTSEVLCAYCGKAWEALGRLDGDAGPPSIAGNRRPPS
jgi:transcription elongation factor Elf1